MDQLCIPVFAYAAGMVLCDEVLVAGIRKESQTGRSDLGTGSVT